MFDVRCVIDDVRMGNALSNICNLTSHILHFSLLLTGD